MSMERLSDCRKAIDVLDLKILALLNERTRIVEEIGRIKRQLAPPPTFRRARSRAYGQEACS